MAETALPDALGPVEDEGGADAAGVEGLLIPAQRRVPGLRPARRVVGVRPGTTDLVHVFEVEAFDLEAVHASQPVHRPEGAASVAGAVVGGQHDEGVVELSRLLEVVDEPPDLDVGVVEHRGEGLLEPARDKLLVGGEAVPGGNARVAWRQDRVLGHDAHRLLALEPLLAGHLVPLIEAAAVLLEVLRRGLVGVVAGAEGDVEEERLVVVDGLLIAHELDGVIDDVLAHVVVRALGRGDAVVVVGELRGELVGQGVEEAVVAVEALLQGPVVERACRGSFGHRGEVPLAHGEGGHAPVLQELRDGRGAVGYGAPAVGVRARPVRDRAHADGVVVAPGEEAGARGRAEGGGVVVGVAQTVRGEPVHVWRVDRGAVAAELGEANVVEDDVDDVREATRVGALRPLNRHLRRFERGVARELGGVRHGSPFGRVADASDDMSSLSETPPLEWSPAAA